MAFETKTRRALKAVSSLRALHHPEFHPMSFSPRDVQISARILVARYGVGALRRAEDHVRRMERLQAHEAAATWHGLALAIKALLSERGVATRALRTYS